MTAASAPDFSVDSAIDALYAGPLEGFVAARNELVKRLRASGDRAAADEVKGLPKPSVSAWATNQLWWHERASFQTLLEAGAAVRAAQAGGAGPSAQAIAAKERRRCLERLLACAEARLAGAGHAAAASTLRKIGTSLEAAAAHGHAPIDPPPGRWFQDLEPPGFDVLSDLAAGGLGAGVSAPPAAPPAAPEPDVPHARDRTSTAPDHAAIARAAAQAEVAQAAQSVDATTRAFDDAAIAAQQAADALGAARARAEAAAREAEQAELRFRRAAKEAEACKAAAEAAHERLREATGLLARTDAELLDD